MRINVYSQELTNEVALVGKTDDKGETHYGIRMYMHSSPLLHCTRDDDDRSAITLWFPKMKDFNARTVAVLLLRMATLVHDHADEMGIQTEWAKMPDACTP